MPLWCEPARRPDFFHQLHWGGEVRLGGGTGRWEGGRGRGRALGKGGVTTIKSLFSSQNSPSRLAHAMPTHGSVLITPPAAPASGGDGLTRAWRTARAPRGAKPPLCRPCGAPRPPSLASPSRPAVKSKPEGARPLHSDSPSPSRLPQEVAQGVGTRCEVSWPWGQPWFGCWRDALRTREGRVWPGVTQQRQN